MLLLLVGLVVLIVELAAFAVLCFVVLKEDSATMEEVDGSLGARIGMALIALFPGVLKRPFEFEVGAGVVLLLTF